MNIFVGNLTRTATAQDLHQLFEPYGCDTFPYVEM